MSNKLTKNQKVEKTEKDKAMKTFFSFNPFGDKVYSLYENSKRKEAATNRRGVNNIISTIVIMLVVISFAYYTKQLSLVIAAICVPIIELLFIFFMPSQKENKKIFVFLVAVNILFLILGIILLMVVAG